MQSLKQDLMGDLDSVQRWWIRVPATLILTVMFLIPMCLISIVTGVNDFIKEFTLPCLRGDKIIYKM